ncbi:Tigger transposable element-derived protein 6, partial [Termitomyces sp. J132]
IPNDECLDLSNGWLAHFKTHANLKGLPDRQHLGVKGKKVCLTYAFTANADGSEKLQPTVTDKANKPHAFQNKTGAQLEFDYYNNAKAWMTTFFYQNWLLQWDCEL